MRRWIVLSILLCLSVCCFTSCSATRTITRTEYVTQPIDIRSAVEPVYSLRPDNGELEFADIVGIEEVVSNSAEYLRAWKLWQNYAEALEGVITDIEETYGPPEEQ